MGDFYRMRETVRTMRKTVSKCTPSYVNDTSAYGALAFKYALPCRMMSCRSRQPHPCFCRKRESRRGCNVRSSDKQGAECGGKGRPGHAQGSQGPDRPQPDHGQVRSHSGSLRRSSGEGELHQMDGADCGTQREQAGQQRSDSGARRRGHGPAGLPPVARDERWLRGDGPRQLRCHALASG